MLCDLHSRLRVGSGSQALLTFSMYVWLGRPLTAPVVFTSLALFNVLTAPLNSFPWVVNGCIEAVVSVRRLQRCGLGLVVASCTAQSGMRTYLQRALCIG